MSGWGDDDWGTTTTATDTNKKAESADNKASTSWGDWGESTNDKGNSSSAAEGGNSGWGTGDNQSAGGGETRGFRGFGSGRGRGGGGGRDFGDRRGGFRGRGRGRGGGGFGDRGDRDTRDNGHGSNGGGGSSGGGWGTNDDQGGSSWGESKAPDGGSSGGGGGWGASNNNGGSNNDDGAWGKSDTKHSKSNADDWGTGDSGGGGGGGGWGQDEGGENSHPRKKHKSDENAHSTSFGGGEEPEERPAPYKPQDLDLDEEAQLNNAGVGENFHRYREQVVSCLPLDLIKPIDKFEDVIESELLLKNVKTLGWNEMTPIQKWAMPAIMGGHDLIACAQTGSGKTAAFLLPVLQNLLKTELEPHDPNSDCVNPYCLIIGPTRELVKQLHTHSEMLSRDSIIKCRYLYGQIQTSHLKARLSSGCHILVATPGRLSDFLNRGWLGFKNVKYVILDEGDRLADESFSKDIKNYFSHESMPSKEDRQTLFFSATFKQEVQRQAQEYLKPNIVFITVGKIGAANEDIKQEFLQVERKEKKRALKKILDEIPEEDKTIVFTQTKATADFLAGYFTSLGLSSTSIHGDRHQSQREEAISAFRRGQKRFLISSPVGNRGLDLPKVALVINYDLPDSIDEYVHRIGRTGRAGRTGKAISFFDDTRDKEILPELLTMLEDAKQEIPEWLKAAAQGGGGFSSATFGTDTGFGSATSGVEDDWGSATSTINETASESKVEETASSDDKPQDSASSGWDTAGW